MDLPIIVVLARDTDIFVLLLAHFGKMSCSQLWLKAGTIKKPKFVPAHEIRMELGLADQVYETLPAFHSITGCDTVSYIAGHTKKTAWNVFLKHNHLLTDLGKSPQPSDQVSGDAEKFICEVYKTPAENCDKAGIERFSKCHATESLPPSSDAAKYHIQRAAFQSFIWRQADQPQPEVPSPTECGWSMVEGTLSPVLTSLPPIPKACKELVQCKCTKGCSNNSCSCRRWGTSFVLRHAGAMMSEIHLVETERSKIYKQSSVGAGGEGITVFCGEESTFFTRRCS